MRNHENQSARWDNAKIRSEFQSHQWIKKGEKLCLRNHFLQALFLHSNKVSCSISVNFFPFIKLIKDFHRSISHAFKGLGFGGFFSLQLLVWRKTRENTFSSKLFTPLHLLKFWCFLTKVKEYFAETAVVMDSAPNQQKGKCFNTFCEHLLLCTLFRNSHWLKLSTDVLSKP